MKWRVPELFGGDPLWLASFLGVISLLAFLSGMRIVNEYPNAAGMAFLVAICCFALSVMGIQAWRESRE